jgi:hypothetical protein
MPARKFEDVPSGIKTTRPCNYIYRAAAAHVRAHMLKSTPESVARELFGHDVVTAEILRSATTQATVGTPSWAGAIGQTAVDDSVMAIATTSAAAGLIERGMKIPFDRRASIRVPGRLMDATDAGSWVGEGKPMTMRTQRMTSGPTLTPHKLCVTTSYSREMAEQSAIEAVSRALIREATGLKLDQTLFGSQTDDGTTPGGILNGVGGLTATAGGGLNALVGDLEALLTGLVNAGAGLEPLLIMAPMQELTLRTMASPLFNVPILRSNALAANKTVIMVEPTSFVSAFGPEVEFRVVNAPLFHYEDTTPTDITGGTPSPAVPVRSLFQTDSLALQMTLRAAWGMRAPHVSFVSYVTW